MFDEGGFSEALQSEDGIMPARACLAVLTRGLARALFCLEVVAQAQLKKGDRLPDW